MPEPHTTIRVDRDSAIAIKQIAVDLSRTERRSVTLGETVTRLIASWLAGPGAGQVAR